MCDVTNCLTSRGIGSTIFGPMLDCGLPARPEQSERTITEHLRKLVRIPPSSALIAGIGDDCAIYRPRGSADDLLFTTDLFIEGVHFLRETHKAADVARKALARSLSDIAAMGGTPTFFLASVCLPKWATDRWIQDFFDTLAASEVILAGGDLSRGDGRARPTVGRPARRSWPARVR